MEKIIEDLYPLSPMQSGLLFQTLYDPDSDAYLTQNVFEIEGFLNRDFLKLSWQKLSGRYSVLRTGFIWKDGEVPSQYVLESVEVPFYEYDWRSFGEKEQDEKIEIFLQKDREKLFDLSQAPVFRVSLIWRSENSYYLIWSHHHILIDGWSLPILLGDLFGIYRSLIKEEDFHFQLPPSYRDYIAWIQDQDLKAAESFWKNYLSGFEEPTRLSFKGMVEKNKQEDYRNYSFNLSNFETDILKNFAQENNLTMNTLIQGAIIIVLKNYAQKPEIVLGITVSGRSIHLSRVEDMVGLFINTFPLRVVPEGLIIDYLNKLQSQTQKLNDYTYASLSEIQHWSGIDQGLFDVLFVFENYPLEEGFENKKQDEFVIKNVRGYERTEYPLTIGVTPGERLRFLLSYQTEHFNEKIIKNISEHIRQTLRLMVQPNKYFPTEEPLVEKFSILTSEKYNEMLIEGTGPSIFYSENKMFHQLFEEQVKKTPHSVAVICNDQKLTYQQLNEQANKLAHILQIEKIDDEQLIALILDRSIEFLTCMIAVFKSRSAYIPIDPLMPQDRIYSILKESKSSIILLSKKYKYLKLNNEKYKLFYIEDLLIKGNNISDPDIPLSHQSLSYVIYTSGSTGKPKGAMVEHDGMLNHLLAKIDDLDITEKDIIAQTATQSFDVSVWQFIIALMVGGRTVVFPAEAAWEPAALLNLLANEGVTIFQTVPSHMNVILNELEDDPSKIKKFNSLRLIIINGEPLQSDICSRWLNLYPHISIINAYGPTECSDDVTHFKITSIPDFKGIIPINGTLQNMKIYILDSNLNPVPVGVPGEIYIGGIGVGRGYLKDPLKTAQIFIPNPFVMRGDISRNNTRLYKTGDLARYLPNKNIEFLGRNDNQVKIRGFRIELGEIETILTQNHCVSQAIVLVHESTEKNKNIIAYVVLKKEIEQDLDGKDINHFLKDYVASFLPDYMVPTYFVVLEDFPLLLNGKIDRKSLPAPDLSHRQVGDSYVAARTEIEASLCAIWSDVLKISPIGIHDNFFKLGGHSLLATQVISRIRSVFERDIPLRVLFEEPTIARLGEKIEASLGEGKGSLLPVITAGVRPDRIPLSFAQQRLWFIDQLLPNSSLYNIPIALRIKGPLDKAVLDRSLWCVIDRHEALRTVFAGSDGEAHQVIQPSFGLGLVSGCLDLRDEPHQEDRLQDLIKEEITKPFKLWEGPLIRGKLICLSEDEHVLVMTLHHIVSDGWSMDIFFREVGYFYGILQEGIESSLESLSIQYGDFSIWQRGWLCGDVLAEQLSYWRDALSGIPDLLPLPTDHPRPRELSYVGSSYRTRLSAEMRRMIESLSQAHGASVFMTLLSVFQILLYRYTGEQDIVVGSPIANRHYKETEDLIGFFVNTLALRTRFRGDESFLDVLGSVIKTTLGAYQHQDVPFEQLVDHLNIRRELNRNPVFQVLFTFQNAQSSNPFVLRGLDVSPVSFPYAVAKFDLSIDVYDEGEGFGLEISYAEDLFEESTVIRLMDHFKGLVSSIVKSPHDSIVSYPLVSCGEYDEIVYDWNGTDFAYGSGDTLDGLFESQVLKTPDGIALVYEGVEVSYECLNERSNRLAHYLRGLGVGCDTLVGLCVDRSIEMVVGILGIMKAGGAYVPLDPTYPEERIQFILTDTACPIILTDSSYGGLFHFYEGRLVFLDDSSSLDAYPSFNLDKISSPQNLAYIIYTSGSTGKPKGVMTSHENVHRLFESTKEWYHFDHQDVWTLFHSYAFDFSVWELWGALLYGGRLVIVPYTTSRSPQSFYKLLKEEGVTILNQTPSAFYQVSLYEEGLTPLDFKRDLSLRCVIFGGEALEFSKLTSWFDRHGYSHPQLINMYGITETTVHVTYLPLTVETDLESDQRLIGHRIPDLHLYILDGGLNPVPVGIGGELYIGGVGLARGYLNRPDLTADRFIPNPFYREGSSSSLRLYRTGDLSRYRSDGVIEFSGRIDDQVKIRGFRIELGEIESTLQGHGEVHQSVVLAREDEGGDKKLVAYVVAREGEAFSEATPVLDSCGESFSIMTGGDSVLLTEDLQAHLRSSLPDYMIPAFFVYVDRLPLTANGKIDRKSLPAPDLSHRQVGDSYVAARTEIEASLCAIWSDVLKMSPIGIHDNFFKLGGHSLLATQVISRIRSVFERDIPLRVLFEEPTIARLGEKIEASLGEGKGSLLPVITAGVRPDRIPLSFAQQRLWFIDQLLPNSSLYNIPIALRIKGPLDRDILDRSLWCVIDRHEALRTVFAGSDGEAHQVIQPSFGLGLVSGCLDLRDEPHQEDRLQDLIKEEITKPFKLWEGPLIRGKLICLSEDEHVLVMTLHHIVSDGWSMDIFFREVGYFYGILQEGIESSLESLSIQYGDFSIWQRGWLCGDVLAEQLSYWRDALSGIPDLLPLPTDHPRPRELSYVGSSYRTRLSAEMRRMIESLSQAHGASVFMTLLSVFQILLYRYTGEQDIVVGSPIANRHYKETEDLIGFFVNALALRTRFRGDESFLDVLGSVIKTTLGAYQHQDVSFEQLVDHLNIRRELNRNPVFQVLFTFQNAQSSNPFVLKNLSIDFIKLPSVIAKVDLSIDVYDEGEGFGLEISYAEDLFEGSTIIRLMDHFKGLVSSIVKSPHDSIVSYPLVSCGEYDEIVYDWNGTDFAYGSGDTLDRLFESQVLRTPDGIALVYEGVEVSYDSLNERSNRLAHYLRGLGVGCDTLVGLCVDRSIEMVVGILGIMKAGGAYVPLDPTYPEERIQFILTDTACPIVLTTEAIADKLPATSGLLICLDKEERVIAQASKANLDVPRDPQSLAYVIYTSGSTGKPKGVMVAHQGLCNMVIAQIRLFSMSDNPRLMQFASISFDASVSEIFTTFLSGGTLILCSKESISDSQSFVSLMQDNRVSIVTLPPSFLSTLSLNQLPFLKTLVLAGESCSDDLMALWSEGRSVINAYGPTESTVCASTFQYVNGSSPSFIGRPIWNTQLYILDGGLNPVPVGIGGELYIGGVGLARGYLNRPDLTADRFIPNPFYREGSSSSFRLYRTGDLARYRSDGVIEFLGRIDDQVKIRGFRIELGEIESTLQGHGEVHQSVVLAREDEGGDKKLVAYVVAREGEAFSEATPVLDSCGESFSIMTGGDSVLLTEDLQAHLRSSLPDYMIPAFFVYVDRLPLTANGKIDRKSLPAPDLSHRQVGDSYVAARTEIEASLCAIWSDVLKMSPIGIHDNFFKLGGHSLLATQVISRIRSVFERDIPLRVLFEEPTIARLGEKIEASLGEGKGSLLPVITAGVRPDRIPLSFAQQRLWFIDQLLPNSSLYNIPIALRIKGPLDKAVLDRSLWCVIDRHEALRTVFAGSDGEAHQVIQPSFGLGLVSGCLDLRDEPHQEDRLQDLIKEEITKPFKLWEGPLIRGKLICLSEDEHVLVMTLHHIVSDGWSMDIFFREVGYFYGILQEGIESSLESLSIQYGDFSIWQRGWLCGDVLAEQLSYWRDALSGIPDLLPLPTDHPRPRELSYVGSSYRTRLSAEMRRMIESLSQAHGASVFMTLLSVFQILLYRYTGEQDIVVGSPIANRHYKETEDLIGFFVNTLALRTRFRGDESFLDVLGSVIKTTLGAYQHQDVPFEQLVDHLNIRRELNRNPVFQVLFTFQNAQSSNPFVLRGLDVSPVSFPYAVAKFDLSIDVYDEGEGFGLEISYAEDLFEESTVIRLMDHFKGLVSSIVKSPHDSIVSYPLVSCGEYDEIVYDWNGTDFAYGSGDTLDGLFESQVLKTPDGIALVYEGVEVSYECLNERSNRLAHYLRGLGVGCDTLVGLCVDRSIEMVVGILGIMKAGGAYVPLDPTYPEERIQFILTDTACPIILTTEAIADKLPATSGLLICLDTEERVIAQASEANLDLPRDPQSLAYVIYTSGSTGKPKGVMISHENLAHYVAYCKEKYPYRCGAGFFHSSFSFDMSITSIFLPLVTGNPVFILPYDANLDLFVNIIQEYDGFGFIKVTPTHLKALKDRSIRSEYMTLVLGGEALLSDDLKFIAESPGINIINEYGPTEATVGCCVFEVRADILPSFDSIPIGRPIWNTHLYILDGGLNPVPVGIGGELYIGGVGLARGYLNRPDLTADRFIPNPFYREGSSSSFRLYRTGDLARYRSDGVIEFLGRIDDQVKIRGFRIELGEIESTLQGHGEVHQSVVLAREDEGGDKKLVAYVVSREGEAFSEATPVLDSCGESFSIMTGGDSVLLTEDLQAHLRSSLPDYMIPAFFVYVDRLPLTANGKIDRKSLPAPDLSHRQVGDSYVAARTEIEASLCAIWSDVLKISPIGIHDNFFRIGGDSIISIQLVSKARAMGIYFSVKDVFNHSTVAELACVSQFQQNDLALKPDQEQTRGNIPLTPIQHWFFSQSMADYNYFNQSVLLKIQKKSLTFDHLNQVFYYLLRYHDALGFRYTFDKVWQQYAEEREEVFSCLVVDLSSCSDKELPSRITLESSRIQSQLDIQNGLLLKVVFFDCGAFRDPRVLIVIHHLVVDGVSWRILLADFEALCGQALRGDGLELPFKTHSYQQWSNGLQTYALSEALDSELSYWRGIESASKSLPIDFDHGPATWEASGVFEDSLTAEETLSLLQTVPKSYRTEMNDILLTALVLGMGDWTGFYSLCLDLEGHGREDVVKDIDLSRTVGWFTTIFPVYLQILDPDDLGGSIQGIKEALRRIPHKGIGYGLLSYLRDESFVSSRSPFLFNYLGQWSSECEEGLFDFSEDSSGCGISGRNPLSHLLGMTSEIRNGVFSVFWTYSLRHYDESTIRRLSDCFIKRLRQIIQHCSGDNVLAYTQSDFKLASINQVNIIDQIINKK
jgi:amino acid adenylation domain-containing protein/non-ribosomal peptide synthase protein (TIGR01720 family)